MEQNTTEEVIDVEITRYKDERSSRQKDDEVRQMIANASASLGTTSRIGMDSDSDAAADDGFDAPSSTRGRGRGRGGRGATAKPRGRGSRGGRGGRGKAAVVDVTPSIKDSFSKASQKTGRGKSKKRYDKNNDLLSLSCLKVTSLTWYLL